MHAALLGAVQGVTEWLPVSSSGHLVLLQRILYSENSVLFDAMVHGGTLLAVLAYYWRDAAAVLRGLYESLVDLPRAGVEALTSTPERALAWYLVVATLPIVAAGLLLQDWVDALFNDARLVGLCYLVTGTWLLLTRLSKGSGPITLKSSVLIGLAQAAAILPGISRSGSTIATGMLSGVDREEAARFSFLLSIPAIGGALLLEAVRSGAAAALTAPNLVGFATAFAVGILSIKFLLGVIRRGKFHLFSIYCFALAALALAIG